MPLADMARRASELGVSGQPVVLVCKTDRRSARAQLIYSPQVCGRSPACGVVRMDGINAVCHWSSHVGFAARPGQSVASVLVLLDKDADKEEITVMTEIPEIYLDLLLQKKAFAHLATVMPDGSPQNTPVWFDYTDGMIRVNSARGRTKVRNMRLGAKVALSIMDPDNSDRYVQLRGTVTRVREDEVAAAHIDSLAHKYLGLDKNPYAKAGDVRVMFEITVFSVQGMS
jgi:PPOX class probable F420-dependent enzyme